MLEQDIPLPHSTNTHQSEVNRYQVVSQQDGKGYVKNLDNPLYDESKTGCIKKFTNPLYDETVKPNPEPLMSEPQHYTEPEFHNYSKLHSYDSQSSSSGLHHPAELQPQGYAELSHYSEIEDYSKLQTSPQKPVVNNNAAIPEGHYEKLTVDTK